MEFEIIDIEGPEAMSAFQVIRVNSVWVRLYGQVWRFFYRAYANVRRHSLKEDRRARKEQNKPRLYRVVIR